MSKVLQNAPRGAFCILQYFWPSLGYRLSLRSLFCLFLSGCFTQVLLYNHVRPVKTQISLGIHRNLQKIFKVSCKASIFLCDIGKQCRLRSDPQNAVLIRVFTVWLLCSNKIWIKWKILHINSTIRNRLVQLMSQSLHSLKGLSQSISIVRTVWFWHILFMANSIDIFIPGKHSYNGWNESIMLIEFLFWDCHSDEPKFYPQSQTSAKSCQTVM